MLSGKLRKGMTMSRQDDLSADHISWLVKSRSENQEITLKLYLIMKDNEEKLKGNWDLANYAQAMAAVCFSLWRAVFLSDLSDEPHDTIIDAQTFLGNLILHNMVAYPQDRNTREWSFMYYVNNARYRLETLSKKHSDMLPAGFVDAPEGFSNAKDFWSFSHSACEVAVRNLEIALRKISN
jgi:hypothetical protein